MDAPDPSDEVRSDPSESRPPGQDGLLGRAFALALGGTLLLLLPLVILGVLALRGPTADGNVPSPTTEAGRRFDLPALDGGRITQADFAGRVVVVNVWASWCAPCRDEAPVFQRMAQEPSPAAFFGMVRLDEPGPARTFARAHGLSYPHALDNGTFSTAHGVTVLPTTLVFAADGSFVGRIEGPVSEARLRLLIEDAAAVGSGK